MSAFRVKKKHFHTKIMKLFARDIEGKLNTNLFLSKEWLTKDYHRTNNNTKKPKCLSVKSVWKSAIKNMHLSLAAIIRL